MNGNVLFAFGLLAFAIAMLEATPVRKQEPHGQSASYPVDGGFVEKNGDTKDSKERTGRQFGFDQGTANANAQATATATGNGFGLNNGFGGGMPYGWGK